MAKPVLKENDGKRLLHKIRRFSSRFRVTLMTKKILTENNGKRILDQKRRFSNIYRLTLMENT